jgi:8-oxo-dGTP diphosphatase
MPHPDTKKTLHVMAAAIVSSDARVLIQRRHIHQHQGGLWEFPGGKLEAGEPPFDGLCRELEEELGIRPDPERSRPLISIDYDYGDKRVFLDVWRVAAFAGTPSSREGQPFDWVPLHKLGEYAFPAANLPVLKALRLPDQLLITPEPQTRGDDFLHELETALVRPSPLIQLRAPRLAQRDYLALAEEALAVVRAAGGRMMLNGAPQLLQHCAADGIHLPERELSLCAERPVDAGVLFSCATHGSNSLRRAAVLDADFALLGAVKQTASHPGKPGMGWTRFAELARAARLPVYALGGLAEDDLEDAWRSGAQGVAAIRAAWPAICAG